MPDVPSMTAQLSQAMLELIDDDVYAEMHPAEKYAAAQMVLFTVVSAILSWHTTPDAFAANKTTMLELHQKLTQSLEALEPEFLKLLEPAMLNGQVH